MSFFGDLLEEVFTNGLGLGPSTSRGMMILGLLLGLTLCGAIGWLLMTAPDPLREPEWGFVVIVLGMIFAPAEIILSSVIVKREPEERALAATALVVNVTALMLAFAAIL